MSAGRLTLRARLAGIRLVALREIGAYFDSAVAYVFVIAFAVLANAIFLNEFFLAGTADMTAFFDRLPLLLAVFLPAVTMRLWAEERRSRTIELLLTLPIVPSQAVLGKFAASLVLYALFLAASLPIVIMIAALGQPDFGLIVAGYLGALFLGALVLALGMFVSALCSDQIVAFVGSSVATFALVLTGDEKVVAVLDGLSQTLGAGTFLYETVSVVPKYESFVRGVVDLAAVVYFTALAAALLWLTARFVERSRS